MFLAPNEIAALILIEILELFASTTSEVLPFHLESNAMMLLPRKQFRNASMSFGFGGPRGAMVVPCNEGGASHLTILRPHHILWKARGASIISLPDAQ